MAQAHFDFEKRNPVWLVDHLIVVTWRIVGPCAVDCNLCSHSWMISWAMIWHLSLRRVNVSIPCRLSPQIRCQLDLGTSDLFVASILDRDLLKDASTGSDTYLATCQSNLYPHRIRFAYYAVRSHSHFRQPQCTPDAGSR